MLVPMPSPRPGEASSWPKPAQSFTPRSQEGADQPQLPSQLAVILAPAVARERQEKAGKGLLGPVLSLEEPSPALHSPAGTRDPRRQEKEKAKKNVSW